MRIDGMWFDGNTARMQPAFLFVSTAGVVTLEGKEEPIAGLDAHDVALAAVSVSAPLGNTPCYMRFPNGGVFETRDNIAVNALLQMHIDDVNPSRDRVQMWAHGLEQHWLAVLASAILLLLLAVWFSLFGAPIAARAIAFRLPAEIVHYIGRDSIAMLDRALFTASELPESRQKTLSALLQDLLVEDSEGMQYRLLFRQSAAVGANAFALPDGAIIITDGLVALAENDGQIAAVLLHEIGHVKQRHLLRQLIQQAGLAALLVTITGDVHGASEMVLAAPGILMQAQYSRAMESEADAYALENMQRKNLSPLLFVQIMRRMEVQLEKTPGEAVDQNRKDDKAWQNVGQYLSTHPATEERIRRFEEAAD